MIRNPKYFVGDRVTVFQNSERIPSMSFIGDSGTVCGTRSKDVLVKFDNGKELYIYENDLIALGLSVR